MRVSFKRVGDAQVALPSYATDTAAGLDLRAALGQPQVLSPGQRQLIGTGLAIELPHGFEAQVRPRSGLALKQGITVLNAPGTIDSDYRGEIGVLLVNLGTEPATIEPGARIAQLVVAPVQRIDPAWTDELSDTSRGGGGFGSTGSR